MDLTIVINTYENHIKYFKKCVSSIPINKNIKLIVIIDEKNKKFQNLISGILIKKKFKNYKITLNHLANLTILYVSRHLTLMTIPSFHLYHRHHRK